MSVALIFPPVVDPRGPHLALPSLAAYLRAQGVDVHLFDANVRSLRHLLEPSLLQKAARTLRNRFGTSLDLSTPSGKLALYGEKIAESIDEALDTLVHPQRFFDANAFNCARETVVSALDLTSESAHPGISCNIMLPRYDIEGFDPSSLHDLTSACGREELNLFAAHWREEILPELSALAPELVGVTITNRQQIFPGLMLARMLRSQGHFVVIGGTVFTKFAAELARLPEFFRHFADAVVVYEGETATYALLEQLRGSRDFSKVPNLVYSDGERVHATSAHVEDVNALPTPDFAGLDLDAYLAPFPVLPILTGKGCYFNRCKFCDIPFINHISRKAYRVRDAVRIAADVSTLAEKFGARHFVITDEALSPKLLLKLADALDGENRRRLRFTGYARLEAGFTPEVCRRLVGMGMVKLYFGLESADQRTLDHMDKGARADEAPVVLRNCAEAGVLFHIFSIIGFPQEPAASARTTLDFFLDNKPVIDGPGNSFDIHPFGLDLRTDYFENRDKLDVTIDDSILGKEFVIGVDPGHWTNGSGLSAEEVTRLLDEEFYPRLREAYRRYQGTPDGIWPGFEEYAVLYGDYYAERDFPYYTCVPALSEGERLALAWSPTLKVMEKGERVLLLQRRRFLIVERRTYESLRDARFDTFDPSLARDMMGERATTDRLARYLNRLIERGYLVVRIER